jgi:hypothetical protein
MKRLITLLFLFLAYSGFSQANQPWRSYFSYNNIKDISQSGSTIYAGAESAVFSKGLLTNELKTITSVDGLKTENVSAIHYSTQYNKLLVGNENGLLLVVNSDNSVLNVIDIIQETTVASNKKKINHIYEFEGKAYISCNFGIAVFNLATLEFGDTYYLGPNGAEIPVLQSTVYNGYIYAATAENGIRKGLLTNPNLNDYNQWMMDNPGSWGGIVTFESNLFAADVNGNVYRMQNGTYAPFAALFSPITDLRSANGYMIATSRGRINVYNNSFAQVMQFNLVPGLEEPVTFTCATVISEKLFIGTQESGVFTAMLSNANMVDNITPNGPLRSNIFSIEKTPNNLWAVYGGFNYYFVPDNTQYGVSRYNAAQGWINIPYEDLNPNTDDNEPVFSVSDIVVRPNNEKEVYVSSYNNGLLKIVNGEPQRLYTRNNTNANGGTNGLESLVLPADLNYKSVRINSLAFDAQNNLWMTNALIDKPLKVLKANGEWMSYSFVDRTTNPKQDSYSKMVIDKNGTKWIASTYNGVIGFNENPLKLITVEGTAGNLPIDYVRSLAIDNNNQLWIGTVSGLRILSNVDSFLTEDELVSRSIIILEEGLAQELMFEQSILDIVVDGANNKWIATANSGAFLVSSNGQETLFHFTKENSPLPSNTINDIEIDAATGEVFFATDKGMVSYAGTSTKGEENLNNVYVFPNPVRPGFEGDVNISGLIDQANIKITDIEGNLVFETTSEGGTVLWNTSAFGSHKVASGVYMIFISSEDGTQTKTKKVMIIR